MSQRTSHSSLHSSRGEFQLSVVLYDKVKTFFAVPDTYVEPTPPPYKPQPDTDAWMRDPGQRDAFCIRQGHETEVHWADGLRDPVLDYDGSREKAQGIQWCSFKMEWSSRGSYMATIVQSKGVILWGGVNYEKVRRQPTPPCDRHQSMPPPLCSTRASLAPPSSAGSPTLMLTTRASPPARASS